jgi:predicted nucleotidyltransferase
MEKKMDEVSGQHDPPAGEDKMASSILDEIVRRIVEVAQPDQIILFGSAARGEVGPDSDLDLLVIKSGVAHRRRLAQEIYLSLFGIPVPVDVVVATPDDIEAYSHKVGTILGPALREGRKIYAVSAP